MAPHTLSNQLILIKVLDWFSSRDLGAVKVSLICVGSYPGMDRFVGLGQLHANQLVSLADTRVSVDETQYRTARAAWNAFTSPDPTEIERFIATDTSPVFTEILLPIGVDIQIPFCVVED
jgi:hypothetical protein